jgi:amino-acid N-acetyltransferase
MKKPVAEILPTITERITYRIGTDNDLAGIKDLLRRNRLPISDIQPGSIVFIVATIKDNDVVGCIGLEQYGTDGLLRSFAVNKLYRSQKIGAQLFSRLLSFSRQAGVSTMHLLTTTAEKYFLRKGFSVLSREQAPASIQSNAEFTSLCPASSAYMIMKNIEEEVSYYSRDSQNIKKDPETGSSFWSIEGKNLQFTWFEVPPNKKFPNHLHDSEQITYVLEGELFFELENAVYKLSGGDSIVIPGNKEHVVWTENSFAKAVDAWSPINESLIQIKSTTMKVTP